MSDKKTTQALLDWCFERELMAILASRLVPSKTKSKLVLVLGENATGKSLFRRAVQSWGSTFEPKKVEVIGLSMADRAGGFMSGFVRAMIYGDENTQATGVNTAHTVTTGISTAQGRENDHVVFWDEPDTGLSDSYAADVGRRIAEFAMDAPKLTRSVFVVTHRKVLIEQLRKADPHVVFMGENAPETLEEFLTRPVVPADIEQLYERSHKLFTKVAKLLNKS